MNYERGFEMAQERYAVIYKHKGLEICTLKVASKRNGDDMGYIINSPIFYGKSYINVQDAIDDIDSQN